MSLLVEDLSFSYTSNKKCLENINLEIPLGTVYGLLGPNGAGKSTLLSILSGLLPLQTGRLSLEGRSVTRLSDIMAISLVPQDFAFYPNLTAKENLQFFAGVQGIAGDTAKARIKNAIEVTALDAYLNQRAATFSGGLKRRLNLAIGLLNAPKLLMLDEPTVGIDAQTRNFLLACIKRLAQQGVGVIYTSHYMEEIESICDNVAIIDHGKIQLQGSIKQLLLEHKQTCHIYLASSPSDQLLQALHQRYPVDSWSLVGDRLELTNPEDCSLAQLLSILEKHHVAVSAIDYAHAKKLETLYLNLTQRELRD